MLVFHWLYHYFLKGQGGQKDSKKTNERACLRFWEAGLFEVLGGLEGLETGSKHLHA